MGQEPLEDLIEMLMLESKRAETMEAELNARNRN